MASIGGQVAHALKVGLQTAQELYGGSKRAAKLEWIGQHQDTNPRYGAVFARETERTALERVIPFARWARGEFGATRISHWTDEMRLAYVRFKVEAGQWRSRSSIEGFWSSSSLVMQCAARAYPGSCAHFAYSRRGLRRGGTGVCPASIASLNNRRFPGKDGKAVFFT